MQSLSGNSAQTSLDAEKGVPGNLAPRAGEALASRLLRLVFNWYPCYRRTGARLTYLSADRLSVRLEIPLNWTTRGYWGTTFGGSLYAALDPVLLVIMSKALGPDYVVWDQSAEVEFVRPGRTKLVAEISVRQDEIDEIREGLKISRKLVRSYDIALADENGTVHVRCKKRLYFRRARGITGKAA